MLDLHAPASPDGAIRCAGRSLPGVACGRVSSQTSPLLVLQPAGRTRSLLVRRARILSLLSIGWMTVEAVVAIVAALVAGSVALLGFGLDSLIELASASTILWLYTGSRRSSDAAERCAQQLIAICFAALALYVAFDAIDTLAVGAHPDTSWPGVAVAAGAIVFMPSLARAKSRVAAQLGSAATAGDAAQSWLCAIGAAAVLLSILANAALSWWWLDPVAGLGIAGLAVREGREAWAGEVCADCAPNGLESAESPSALCMRRGRRSGPTTERRAWIA
jgi:Co/Zn/Cd efflux system component